MKTMTDNTVQTFAAAVRAELADLPKRELEELTEGLAADLEERFAEEGLAFNPGSAAAYAAELREAAGVAPKPTKRKAFSSAALIDNTEGWFRSTALGTAVLEFGISIRPVWWALRALVAWLFIAGLGFNSASSIALLPVFVFLSIQWGRKTWFTNRFFASILLPLNLIAILLLIPAQELVIQRINNFTNAESMLQNWPATDGLRLDGEPITELKAFDANQQEVLGLSYNDQSGNSLVQFGTEPGEPIEVPDLKGLNMQDLNNQISQLGISGVDFNHVDDATEVEARVIATVPAAGEFIDPKAALLVIIGRTN
jgi:hypothetical protein